MNLLLYAILLYSILRSLQYWIHITTTIIGAFFKWQYRLQLYQVVFLLLYFSTIQPYLHQKQALIVLVYRKPFLCGHEPWKFRGQKHELSREKNHKTYLPLSVGLSNSTHWMTLVQTYTHSLVWWHTDNRSWCVAMLGVGFWMRNKRGENPHSCYGRVILSNRSHCIICFVFRHQAVL